MENAKFSDISTAAITFNSVTYNSSYAGVYSITVTYKWGGAGTVTSLSRTFTYTLVDPCVAFITIPTFSNLSGLLHDPNTTINVKPTLS